MGGAFDIDYGRMSTSLGLEVPGANTVSQIYMGMPYNGPPLELIKGSVYGTLIGSLGDGTQIWTISHNGVDTHPIHFHLYNVQLINRVAWDNIIREPDPNELGWKETVRISPLQTTTVALRPTIPSPAQVPFPVPNSVRLIDPGIGEGDALRPPSPALAFMDPLGNATGTILNHVVNYGWEYVWHCHILAHEEMDMMHAQIFAIAPEAPSNLGFVVGTGPDQVTLYWNDNSLGETGFTIQRAEDAGFTLNPVSFTVVPDVTSYVDGTIVEGTTYYYRVMANNMVGDTQVYPAPSVGYEHYSVDSTYSAAIATDGTSLPTPPTPLFPAPASNIAASASSTSNIATLTPNLDWSDVSGATSYALQVSTDPGFVLKVVNQTGLASPSFTIPGGALSWNTTYYWRASATGATGTSAWSETWSFQPVPPIPGTPALTSPANGSTASTSTLWLLWSAGGGGAPASYGIQVATDPGFATIVLDQAGITSAGFMVPAGIIQCNTIYYWRVDAANANGTSGWSTARSFLSPVPAFPIPTGPFNASTINTLTPRLEWYGISACADNYTLQVSTDPGFGTTVINQAGLNSLFYDVPTSKLDWNHTYYWRVSATNTRGTSAWSPDFSVFTLYAPLDSPSITTTSLPNGKTGTAYSQTLQATGGTPPYTWDNTTALPSWLTLDAFSGVIAGTPVANGTFAFTARVTDNLTARGTRALSLIVAPKSPGKAITAFNFNGLSPAVIGTVNEPTHTVALTGPFGTNVTTLVPTIIHTGASVNPTSGSAQNFTNPVTYTVTAEDASAENYIVTVTFASSLAVTNNPATNITTASATLNGNLTSTGGKVTTVHIYGGFTDGGTNPGNWSRDEDLGVISEGAFHKDIIGLRPNTRYYYRCFAENSEGSAWATESASFVTQSTWAEFWEGPGKDWWRFSSGMPH